MTPTEQDKELDEILDYFLTDIYMNNEHFAANQEALDKTKEEPMQAILDWHNKQVERREREARLNEVQNAYEYWINGRKFISSYFRDRIAELSSSKESADERQESK